MRTSLFKKLIVVTTILISFSACAQKHLPVSLDKFEEFTTFQKPVAESGKIRIPVILIPGFKGSLLKRNGEPLWEKSYTVAFRHLFDELEMDLEAQSEGDFKTYYRSQKIEPAGILSDYHIGGRKLSVKLSVYNDIQQALQEIGGFSEGKDLYTFSYDWRIDNRIAAVRLALKIQQVQDQYRKYLEDALGNDFKAYWDKLYKAGFITKWGQIKVNLVAHSMGGLVSRYYIQMLHGGGQINKLIMLGTPNLGSMDSLRALAEGEYPESIFHFYSKKKTRPIIFSWAATFQLLPRYPGALHTIDNSEVSTGIWGLSGKDIDFDMAITNWDTYNLLPSNSPKAKSYLKYQLKDSYNFYQALNGNADNNYEQDKLVKIRELLDVNIHNMPPPSENESKIIIFGGHCESTLKYAFLGEIEGKNRFVFKKPAEDKEDLSTPNSYSQGDGRVPVDSLDYRRIKKAGEYEFLMCTEHTEMVKDRTFQYNLLRELLAQSQPTR